ncbi:tetratricopeptide repeat protein [Ralstonia sp. 25C]|uniref:tetratricopeptide repeat protein n=1 Tax=Ralstonia sp. 25C TaxID=3447363 RepID=UPI003F74D48D
MRFRLSAALLGAAFFCSALPVAARDWIAPNTTLGRGAQVHQFVLIDPTTSRPMPNARYRLFLPDHTIAGKPPKAGETDSVIFGTTDGAGRTAKVRLPKRYAAARWVFDAVVGDGDFGESFRLVSTLGRAPIKGHPYLVDVVGAYMVCGHSNSDGNTVYVQSRESRTVNLESAVSLTPADDAWCASTGRAIADSYGTPGAPDLFTQYLGTLTANTTTLSDDLQGRIARKLMSLAIAERNAERIDFALDLRPVPEDELNSVGYELADAGLRVERGLSMIETYLAKHPDDPFALDSKGWALYRLGLNDEALTWFDRSIAVFAKPDGTYEASEDAVREARAEGLAHKGEVLWKLGRTDEAQASFKQGLVISPQNDVLMATLARLAVTLPSANAQ